MVLPQISSPSATSPRTPRAPIEHNSGAAEPCVVLGSLCPRAPSWNSSAWNPSGVFSLHGAQPCWYAPAAPSMRLCLPRLQIYLGKVETAFVYLSAAEGIYSSLQARAAKHAGSCTLLLGLWLSFPSTRIHCFPMQTRGLQSSSRVGFPRLPPLYSAPVPLPAQLPACLFP